MSSFRILETNFEGQRIHIQFYTDGYDKEEGYQIGDKIENCEHVYKFYSGSGFSRSSNSERFFIIETKHDIIQRLIEIPENLYRLLPF